MALREREDEVVALASPREVPLSPEDLAWLAGWTPDAAPREGVEKYSDDQARDESGKWTDGGGSGGAAVAEEGDWPTGPTGAVDAPTAGQLSPKATREANAFLGWSPNAKTTPVERARQKDRNVRDVAQMLALANVPEKDLEALADDVQSGTSGKEYDVHQRVIDGVQNHWAQTSGDSSGISIAIQRAAAAEFGLTDVSDGHYDARTVPGANAFYERHEPALRATVRAIYANTQAALAEHGVKELTLFRGMVDEKSQGDDGARLGTMRLQALSSFSSDSRIAAGFAAKTWGQYGDRVLIAARVPASHIFSTARTGPGCLPEGEYIILGGEHRAAIYRNASGTVVGDEHFHELATIAFNKLTHGKAAAADAVDPDDDLDNADWPKRTPDSAAALEAAAKLLTRYSDDQPRDDAGRWSDGGSGGGAATAEETGGGSGGATLGAAALSPTSGFAETARTAARARLKKGDERDINWVLGHRGMDGDEAAGWAMAERVEREAGTAGMLTALDSHIRWPTGWAVAVHEWEAAGKLGGNGTTSKTTKEEIEKPMGMFGRHAPALTDQDVAAFKARAAVVQDYLRREHGDTLTLYRGVHGPQARKLLAERAKLQADGHDDPPVDMKMYSLASFTFDRYSAAEFAGPKGAVVKFTVPVTDAWLAPREFGPTGPIKFANEWSEVVLLNKAPSRTGSYAGPGVKPRRRDLAAVVTFELDETEVASWQAQFAGILNRAALQREWGRYAQKYSDDQPRDESGRWTDGGGGSGGGQADGGGSTGQSGGGQDDDRGAPSPKDYVRPGTRLDAHAEAVLSTTTIDDFHAAVLKDPEVQAAREKLRTGIQTRAMHTDADGNYTPERAALHDQIVEEVLSQGQIAPGETPTLVMFIGAPGSGKTTVLGGVVDQSKFAKLNVDDIRDKLPEYDPRAAGLTQDEIADIEAKIVPRLVDGTRNVLIDWTGKTAEKVEAVARAAKAAGYNVEAYEVHVPTVESAKRTYARFKYGDEHRFVDPSYVLSVDGKPAVSYASVRDSGAFDKWESYDNSGPFGTTATKVDGGSKPGYVRGQPTARAAKAASAASRRQTLPGLPPPASRGQP